MSDYERGAVSRTLRVQNLADSVDEQDLRFIFGCVLPLSLELSYVFEYPPRGYTVCEE